MLVKWRCATVAVKQLKGLNEDAIKIFYRELNNMTNLRSPYLVIQSIDTRPVFQLSFTGAIFGCVHQTGTLPVGNGIH